MAESTSGRTESNSRTRATTPGVGFRRTLDFVVGAAILFLVVSAQAAETQEQLSRVNEIKAAVTFNVLKFVEWPSDDDSERSLCVAADATLGEALVALDGREASGKRVKVRVLEQQTDPSGCDVLVVSEEAVERESFDWDAVRQPELLTVGEGERFVRQGGMVALRVWRNRVQLQINIEAVEEGGLRMSSQLLSLAEVMGAEPNGG